VILKLAAVFALVLILMVIRAPISVAIAAGAVLIGILFPMPVLEIGDAFLSSLINFHTINYLVLVYLILLLSRMMRQVGALSRFSHGADYLLRGSRIGLVSTPMFVGLLPMPGGALLTAPMVSEQARPHRIAPGLLTYLNYWFRHIWEYFWPLYPPIIIGMAILDISYDHFLINQSYMSVAAVGVGSVVLFGFVKRRESEHRPKRAKGRGRKALKDLLYGVSPILAVMVLIGSLILIQRVLPQGSTAQRIASEFPVSLLMLGVVIVSWFAYHVPVKSAGKILLAALDWRVLTLLVAVMFFREMFTRSDAVIQFEEIIRHASPTVLPILVIGLPFSVGLLVGLNQAYVGATFPLLAPFIVKDPGLIMLAYVFGFMGCLLSPAHLCLVFSREYFKASWASVYKWLAPSVLVLGAVAFGVWLVFF
jgi:integral membrane protein (TIGR00529 family)